MIETVEGFVISETNYKETSKIINVFTKEYGIIGIYARGAKSLKSKFRVATLPLSYSKFEIKYKQNSLSTLISADIIDDLTFIKTDLLRVSYYNYIIDLSSQCYRESNNFNIFDLLKGTVLKINAGFDPLILCNVLEVKLLEIIGCKINLTICSNCQKEGLISTINVATSDSYCECCSKGKSKLDPKVIKLLLLYQTINIEKLKKVEIDSDLVEIINQIIKGYYENFTGIYVYSKKFLEDILKKCQ